MTYNSEIHYLAHSIPAVPNSAVNWVLALMSPMPKVQLTWWIVFGTIPRAPITTDTFSSVLTILKSLVTAMIVHFCVTFSTRIISGLLCATVMSVCIVRSQYNSTSSFSMTSARVCSYQLSELSSPCLLHIPNVLFWQHCRVFFCTVSVPAWGNH